MGQVRLIYFLRHSIIFEILLKIIQIEIEIEEKNYKYISRENINTKLCNKSHVTKIWVTTYLILAPSTFTLYIQLRFWKQSSGCLRISFCSDLNDGKGSGKKFERKKVRIGGKVELFSSRTFFLQIFLSSHRSSYATNLADHSF